MGKWKIASLHVIPGINSLGSTRALRAHRGSEAAPSSWGRDVSLCLPEIFMECPVQLKANFLAVLKWYSM